jgi:hypothetical protein
MIKNTVRGGSMKIYKNLFLTILFLTVLVFCHCVSFHHKGGGYPDISVFPSSLSYTLDQGETSKKWIIISNDGGLPLPFDISIELEDTLPYLGFDGADDYVEIPDDPSLSAIGGALTLEFRMKVGEYPFKNREVLGKWGASGSSDDEFDIDLLNTGRIRMSISGSTGGYSALLSNPISPYTWTHVAGVFDSASTSLKLFINGDLDANTTPSTITLDRDTDQPFRMGTYDFYFYPNFKGQLDEVRIWNIARTQAEIQADMDRELSGDETGLIGYWKFNEGSDNTAYDSSPNNNDGILLGGVRRGTGWISINNTSGTVSAGDNLVVEIDLDATALDAGDYNSNLIISSIDPDEPEIIIPVHLTVR